jgi:hypothetical protein
MSANPYQPSLVANKLSPAEAADVERRDIGIFVLLCVVTLGLYWFYVGYQWAKEINGLAGRVKYQPLVFLLVNILTCGLAGMVFECLYAFDIAEHTQSRGIKNRLDQLPMWVIVLNSVAVVASLTGVGIVLALPLGMLASVLVQVELNKLAELYAK